MAFTYNSGHLERLVPPVLKAGPGRIPPSWGALCPTSMIIQSYCGHSIANAECLPFHFKENLTRFHISRYYDLGNHKCCSLGIIPDSTFTSSTVSWWPGEGSHSLKSRMVSLKMHRRRKIKNVHPWLVWLSVLSAGLQTKKSLVQLPVKAYAWVVAGPQFEVCERQPHIDVSLLLFLPPFSFL